MTDSKSEPTKVRPKATVSLWPNGAQRYFQSAEGDIGQLPGSSTGNGSHAIAGIARRTLQRVRDSIRSRQQNA